MACSSHTASLYHAQIWCPRAELWAAKPVRETFAVVSTQGPKKTLETARWTEGGAFVDWESHFMFSYFCVSRTLVTGGCDRCIKRGGPGRCLTAQRTGFASLPHSRTIILWEAEARQVASALKHLLASSMGMSHRGRGLPFTSPDAGVSWQTLPGSGTNGLFILPPCSSHSFLTRLAQIPATCLQGSKTLRRPDSHFCQQSLCPQCPAIPVSSMCTHLTLSGIFLLEM